MEKHVKNYLQAFGYDESSFIPCEMCGAKSVDIHHIEPRSKFGSKRKDEQDHISNLVALCRDCHDRAHGSSANWYKAVFMRKVENRD
jgi:hypothetical protein